MGLMSVQVTREEYDYAYSLARVWYYREWSDEHEEFHVWCDVNHGFSHEAACRAAKKSLMDSFTVDPLTWRFVDDIFF